MLAVLLMVSVYLLGGLKGLHYTLGVHSLLGTQAECKKLTPSRSLDHPFARAVVLGFAFADVEDALHHITALQISENSGCGWGREGAR